MSSADRDSGRSTPADDDSGSESAENHTVVDTDSAKRSSPLTTEEKEASGTSTGHNQGTPAATESSQDDEVAGLSEAMRAQARVQDLDTSVSHSDYCSTMTNSGAPTDSSYRGARIRPNSSASNRSSDSHLSGVGTHGQIKSAEYGSGSASSSGRGSDNRPTKTINVWDSQLLYQRPGYCKAGSDSIVFSNHYTVKIPDDGIEVYQYNIEMYIQTRNGIKQLKKKEEMRPIFWKVVDTHPAIFGGEKNLARLIYNDNNMLFVHGPLNMPQGQETIMTRNERQEIKVVIKMTNVKRANRHSQIQEERDLVVTLVDAILTQRVRCTLHSDSQYFVSHGHGVFFIPDINWNQLNENPNQLKYWVNLGKGLCSWTGLHGAIKLNLQHERLLYNVDINHSVYYKTGCNLVKFISEVCTRGRESSVDLQAIARCGMNIGQRKMLERYINGLSIYSEHTNQVKHYKIEGVMDKSAITFTFTQVDQQSGRSRQINIVDYFAEMYNIQLRFPNLPLIKIKKRQNHCLPMELLFLSMEPQKFKGQPSEEQLANFIRETAVTPLDRKKMIEFLAGSTGTEISQGGLMASDPFMDEFGVTIEQKMQEVDCKFLPRPQLEFFDHFIDGPQSGIWDIIDKETRQFRKVLRPTQHPIAFQLVYVDDVAVNRPATMCFKMLMHTLDAFGLPILQDTPINNLEWNSPSGWPRGSNGPGEDKSDGPRSALEQLVGDFKQMCYEHNPDIIPISLFVMPRKSADAYSLIKYVCECKLKVFCQAILLKTYNRLTGNVQNNTVAHNMFMKITGKLGATHYRLKPDGTHKNWTKVTNPKEPVLFIGVDVTHPGKEERQKQEGTSIASIVGNVDIDAMQYRTSIRIQKTGQEMLVMMTDEIANRIADFNERTNLRPEHIVIYRDGVSETEFKKVLHEEKKAIENAFTRFAADNSYRPTITYIVASKRHHTRFFPKEEKDTFGQVYNLRPGLLVEKTITSKEHFDFYLLSHAGPLGTSRPTHYYVLFDEWHPSTAFWQTITYALTFMYLRTPKSVSLPAPVYYAHLAAKKAAAHLKAYDYYCSHLLKGKQEWEASQMRTEAVNSNLDGMIFV